MLSPPDIKRFYDRLGSHQDQQAFYEDAALDDLFAHADFLGAGAILEFGCGTGRFAERILTSATTATYVGFDVSTTMVRLASHRLARFGDRVHVRELEPGAVRLPVSDHIVDRVVSTYVLDLLPAPDIEIFLGEARRVLTPHGHLCMVSLTSGQSGLPRLVTRLWELMFRIRPQLVGGCRPLDVRAYLDGAWHVLHHRILARWGVPSEIVVAHAHAA